MNRIWSSLFSLGKAAALFAVVLICVVSCAGSKPSTQQLSAEEKFRQAMSLFDRGKYENARLLFESVIFDNPGSVVADSAQYLVGACYFQQKEYELAAGDFQRFFMQYPTSALVDDAELMRARCYFLGAPRNTGLDQHYTENCVNILNAFRDDHPSSDLLPAADSLLAACWERLSKKDFNAGKLYQRLKAYRAAVVYYQLVLDQYPDSPQIPETIYRMGEAYRGLAIYDTAVVWYEKLVYLYPDDPVTVKAKKRITKLQPFLPDIQDKTVGDNP